MRRLGVWLAAAAAAGAACGGGPLDAQRPGGDPAVAGDVVASDITVPAWQAPAPPPASQVPQGVADLLPPPLEQREFSADDPPTFAEYERAVFASVACIEALGFEVVGPYLNSESPNFIVVVPGVANDRLYVYGVVDGVSSVGANISSEDALDLCWERFEEPVSLYGMPTEGEIKDWYEQFRQCLIRKGIDEAAEFTLEQLDDEIPDYRECMP